MCSWAWNSTAARSSFSSIDRELHGAHHDLLVGDAQEHPAADEMVLLPEDLELRGEGRHVDDLALGDEALGQRLHGGVGEHL